MRGVRGQALSLPRLPAHWAGCWGPPPTCCGRGCVVAGAQHSPLGLHALWGLRAAGVVGGRPGGGVACHSCEWRLVSGAVPPPAPRALERAARVLRPVCPGCGRCGRGHPAPAPQRAPLRVGVVCCGGGGRASPGGGAFHHNEGRPRSGAVPPPTARPLGGLLGSATHVLWARMCECGDPTLAPWPACPVGAACRGAGGGLSPGGSACHCCEGRLVSGAVPPPAARPLERAARVPRPVCPGRSPCGRGDPAAAPRRAPLLAGVARCWGGRRASPGGASSTIVRGVWGQALSLPRLPAHWAGCWGPPPTCCGRGCGCVRCVWCLCGACRGARCRFSLVSLVLSSPVLRCGVVPAVCGVLGLAVRGRVRVGSFPLPTWQGWQVVRVGRGLLCTPRFLTWLCGVWSGWGSSFCPPVLRGRGSPAGVSLARVCCFSV